MSTQGHSEWRERSTLDSVSSCMRAMRGANALPSNAAVAIARGVLARNAAIGRRAALLPGPDLEADGYELNGWQSPAGVWARSASRVRNAIVKLRQAMSNCSCCFTGRSPKATATSDWCCSQLSR